MPKQLDRISNPNKIQIFDIDKDDNIITIKDMSLNDIFKERDKEEKIFVFFYNVKKSEKRNKMLGIEHKEYRTVIDPLYLEEEKEIELFIEKNKEKILDYNNLSENTINEKERKKIITKINNQFYLFKKNNIYYLLFSFKNFWKMFLWWKYEIPIKTLYNKKYTINDISFYDNETGESYLAL